LLEELGLNESESATSKSQRDPEPVMAEHEDAG